MRSSSSPARERDLLLDHRDRCRRRLLLEHAAEDAVVNRNLFRTGDERQAARPVEVVRGERGRGAAEVDNAAGPDGEPFVAQRTRERDEPLELVSH